MNLYHLIQNMSKLDVNEYSKFMQFYQETLEKMQSSNLTELDIKDEKVVISYIDKFGNHIFDHKDRGAKYHGFFRVIKKDDELELYTTNKYQLYKFGKVPKFQHEWPEIRSLFPPKEKGKVVEIKNLRNSRMIEKLTRVYHKAVEEMRSYSSIEAFVSVSSACDFMCFLRNFGDGKFNDDITIEIRNIHKIWQGSFLAVERYDEFDIEFYYMPNRYSIIAKE